jgi:hypothetical protein
MLVIATGVPRFLPLLPRGKCIVWDQAVGGLDLHQGKASAIRTKIVQTLLLLRLVENLVKPRLVAKLLCHAEWQTAIEPIGICIPCWRLPLHLMDAQTLAFERDASEQPRTNVLIAMRSSHE